MRSTVGSSSRYRDRSLTRFSVGRDVGQDLKYRESPAHIGTVGTYLCPSFSICFSSGQFDYPFLCPSRCRISCSCLLIHVNSIVTIIIEPSYTCSWYCFLHRVINTGFIDFVLHQVISTGFIDFVLFWLFHLPREGFLLALSHNYYCNYAQSISLCLSAHFYQNVSFQLRPLMTMSEFMFIWQAAVITNILCHNGVNQ